MRLFFEIFWIAPKDAPFICFDILQHNGCQKIAKGPPFYIFRHCDTVQKSHFKKFFWEIFSCLQRVPLQFFSNFLQPAGVSQSPTGLPFSVLSLRYGADFDRSRLRDTRSDQNSSTPKILQNFKKTPNCTRWPKELNQKGFPFNIRYRTRPKGPLPVFFRH